MPAPTRRVLSATDVRDAVAAGAREVVVPPTVRVTPLARDTARELGVTLVERARDAGSEGPGGELERQVRRIVATIVAADPHPSADPRRSVDRSRSADRTPRPPVRHVDGRSVVLEPFPYDGPEPGQDVRSADVVTSAHGSPVAAGFLSLTRGCFPWTLTYDEVQYVIEGELHIGTTTDTVVGRPGDVLFVPAGTSITFGTPSWARFLYVTFPADWEESLT